jgi:hypothetical protein
MRRSFPLSTSEATQPGKRHDEVMGIRCPLPTRASSSLTPLTPDVFVIADEAGCPLARFMEQRLQFETLLADLSATFVNLAADRVDSQIEAALQNVVQFLEIDRAGLA